MKKYICIHGHFYQPPRENAWLETIEQQDLAYPYHDWNELINTECYGPNAHSRILNDDGKIKDIVNNYSRISFNFGPTLLSWLQVNAEQVYLAIINADKKSVLRFSGHGSAIAQVYNHMIMPLANRRDKSTQVKWGMEDFRHRFEREAKGIWLAETAVDIETLEVLAENDINFTILAPRQMRSHRKIGETGWLDPQEDDNFQTRAYLCNLPSGKSISLFFYNDEISQAVAFNELLHDGKKFAKKLFESFDRYDSDIALTHIATDGESYGHHKKHGDMALASCLKEIEETDEYILTNYSEFLELHPPEYEVQIHENSSWSCIHGIERWRSDCGCSSSMNSSIQQKWRRPLRNSLDELRDKHLEVYESEMPFFSQDIWAVRDDYVKVILNRKQENIEDFILKHCNRLLKSDYETKFLRLLEMQRYAMLMFTSCGWFFDDISGIETVQILQYANRAIQLVEQETKMNLNAWFREELKKAPGNKKLLANGKIIYENMVEPKRLTLTDVAAHYAVATLFEDNPEQQDIWNYTAKSKDYRRYEAGDLILSIGRTIVKSKVTHSVKKFDFAVLYLGQSHLTGSMSVDFSDEAYEKIRDELISTFKEGQISETIGKIQHYFGQQKFSIWNLFRDEQRKVLLQIAEKYVDEVDEILRNIYNRNYSLMSMLHKSKLPLPILFKKNREAVINHEILSFFRNPKDSPAKLESLEHEAINWDIPLDKTQIEYYASKQIFEMFSELQQSLDEIVQLERIKRILTSIDNLNLKPKLTPSQNIYFQISKTVYTGNNIEYNFINSDKKEWDSLFREIGRFLQIEL